ncbi:MAG: tetratricopeptide repeat protein, partial [Caldilineaceae bacterium]
YYAQDDLESAVENYLEAVAIDDEYASVYNSLCWSYSLLEQPEEALPHCEKAIELDPDPNYYDSRGLAHALLGDDEAAIADFQFFIDEIGALNDEAWAPYVEKREAWVEALEAGKNPFTAKMLEELRTE